MKRLGLHDNVYEMWVNDLPDADLDAPRPSKVLLPAPDASVKDVGSRSTADDALFAVDYVARKFGPLPVEQHEAERRKFSILFRPWTRDEYNEELKLKGHDLGFVKGSLWTEWLYCDVSLCYLGLETDSVEIELEHWE